MVVSKYMYVSKYFNLLYSASVLYKSFEILKCKVEVGMHFIQTK